jgi:predicted nucleic-acid-binding protein
MNSIVDTNVVVRFLIGDKTEKFKGVYEFFKTIEEGQITVELPLIVLFQTIFVLKSYYKVPKIPIATVVAGLLQLKGLKIKQRRMIERMLKLWQENATEIVDAYLIACLEKDPRNTLYSYDTDFDKYEIHRIAP